jgi:hypothetical protein
VIINRWFSPPSPGNDIPSVRDEGFSHRVNFSLVFLSGLVYYFGLDKQGAFTEGATAKEQSATGGERGT